jgi:hypothetical protein
MALGGGSHGMAPKSGGRPGAGTSLGGQPRNQVASGRLSQVRHLFASAPPRAAFRGVAGAVNRFA